MSDLVKVVARTAGELLAQFELSEAEAEPHLVPGGLPQVSIEQLAKHGFYSDAVKLLAHGMPKREAVWWACLAARQAQSPEAEEDDIQALLAAEAWARTPTEPHRQRCRTLSAKTKYQTAASWAATAAFWSTGSLAKAAEPDIAVPQFLYAHAVAGAVSLAGATIDPSLGDQIHQCLLNQGLDLARGGDGQIEWLEALPEYG